MSTRLCLQTKHNTDILRFPERWSGYNVGMGIKRLEYWRDSYAKNIEMTKMGFQIQV